MARYFIHIFDGKAVRDEVGEELPDIAAARFTALRVMSEVAGSREDRFWRDGRLRIVVENEARAEVVVLEMRDVTPS